MDYQILYTEPALDDLEAIMAWSWAHHPGSTERFANSLLNHVELLRSFIAPTTPASKQPPLEEFEIDMQALMEGTEGLESSYAGSYSRENIYLNHD